MKEEKHLVDASPYAAQHRCYPSRVLCSQRVNATDALLQHHTQHVPGNESLAFLPRSMQVLTMNPPGERSDHAMFY